MIKKAILTCLLLLFVLCISDSTAQKADPPPCKHFSGTCGDVDNDLKISISDAVFLINFIFAGGPTPPNYWAVDCNLDGKVNISDAVYLVVYIFASGPAPCAAGGDKLALDSPFYDCLEYTYDGVGILTIRHINSSFNCCPEEITIEAFKVGQSIRIYEEEVPNPVGPCPCMCLYDLTVTVEGIVPGTYRIVVDEPNLFPGDPVIDFVAELNLPTTDQFCIYRDTYPWGNPW